MPKQRKKKEGVYRRKGSKYWWASYTETSGRRVQRSTETTTKREALALRSKWKTEVWNQQAREIEFDISSLKSISGSTAQALKQIIYMEQDDQI